MKPWYRSRTLWVNIASALLAIVLLAEEQIRASILFVPDEWKPLLLFALASANIVLRLVTSQPIGRTTERGR